MPKKNASNEVFDGAFVEAVPKKTPRNAVKRKDSVPARNQKQPPQVKTAPARPKHLRNPNAPKAEAPLKTESAPRRKVPLRGEKKSAQTSVGHTETASKTTDSRKKLKAKRNVPTAKKTTKSGAKRNDTPVSAEKNTLDESIRVQSKKQREKKKNAKKISGSAKKLEIKQHDHNRKTTFRIKKKRSKLKYLLRMAAIYSVLVLIVLSLVAAFYAIKLNAGTGDDEKSVYVTVGDEEDERAYNYVSNVSYGNSLYNICIDDINELYELTVTGDKTSLKYICENGTDNVSFDIGTRIAYINGTKLTMESESYLLGGRLYVSASFVKSYFLGISCKADDENGIVIERVTVEKDKDGNNIYLPLSFSLKQNQPIAVISEESIG